MNSMIKNNELLKRTIRCIGGRNTAAVGAVAGSRNYTSSHGHKNNNFAQDQPHLSLPTDGSNFFKNRKYHFKNENHTDNFDQKAIYPYLVKKAQNKSVQELKDEYQKLIEQTKRDVKHNNLQGQDKIKDYSLGID
ncbi:hypothetical protein CYY_004269 [Polysphondylium violaceum]|uniref:Uncharacterized protein n=1 Tax=Polysphondylium violaceum TaxID=133409 RepID=A0A8J4V0G1_9MYCE|nr:hypothetical protein CYY_004269 [Polysphondylium violaceum]